MCSRTCLEFLEGHLIPGLVRGKSVLDVGGRDVNGSARSLCVQGGALSYLSVDLVPGKGVDQVCRAEDLEAVFGPNSFDLVISTEMLEHVDDWLPVIRNMKAVLRPMGTLLLTTRSKGFPYHEYPIDRWRFELPDMLSIFRDFSIQDLQSDPLEPGVFIAAIKVLPYVPAKWEEDIRPHRIIPGQP